MKLIFFLAAVCLFSVSNLIAQDSNVEQKTYGKYDLRFNYPSDWVIADKTTPEEVNLQITKPGTSLSVIISSPQREFKLGSEFLDFQRAVDAKYVELISQTIGGSRSQIQEDWQCLEYQGKRLTGKMISGQGGNEPATGEIYPFVIGTRFVTLVYYRTEKDSAAGNLFWKDFLASFTFTQDRAGSLFWTPRDTLEGGIVNKKALKLAKPAYLKEFAGARGRVEVGIEIDERGKVVRAKAYSGNPVFYAEAERAAKRSKFAPLMLCDIPKSYTGRIVYIFSPR
jgi:hypothetical protein